MLGSLGISSESSIGTNVGSDLEGALALGTSKSNDELECFRLRTTVIHKDDMPCIITLRI